MPAVTAKSADGRTLAQLAVEPVLDLGGPLSGDVDFLGGRADPRGPDRIDVDREPGDLRGLIEVVDGRWGASLEINPDPDELEDWQRPRPVPLLLYDLWNDPFCVTSDHEEHPDLVEHYTQFLEAQWEAHQALAQRFTRSGDVVLTPEQLQTLRTLGYIQ